MTSGTIGQSNLMLIMFIKISLPSMNNGYGDYKWFLVLVNTASRNAMYTMYKLKTQVVNNLGLSISYFFFNFSFDKQTKLISLYIARSDFEELNPSPLSICLNKPLYRLFNSLPLQIKKNQVYCWF
jgi:hypothetical protein